MMFTNRLLFLIVLWVWNDINYVIGFQKLSSFRINSPIRRTLNLDHASSYSSSVTSLLASISSSSSTTPTSASDSIKLTDDSGVVKTVISTKKNTRSITTGDIVAISYSLYTSNNLNKPIATALEEQLVVNDGTMIKGWDIGILSMNVGEKSIIDIKSEYAYGNKGVSPIISPNTDLKVDIQILAWLGNSLQPETLFSKDLVISNPILNYGKGLSCKLNYNKKQFINSFIIH